MQTEIIIEARWTEVVETASSEARLLLSETAKRRARDFAVAFYDGMKIDPDAGGFLSNKDVTARLHGTMQRWIVDILSTWSAEAIPGVIAAQRQMGVVHARIGMPVELVMRGARLLKQEILSALLHENVGPVHFEASKIAVELIDMAIETVTNQYSKSHEVAARKDEAYRTYAASVNVSVERERQRAALFNWQNEMLQAFIVGHPATPLPLVAESACGLWLRHKASSIFAGGGGELRAVMESVARIDALLVPFNACRVSGGEPEDHRRLLDRVLNEAKHLQIMIDSLFEHLITIESGRDDLTQLLSRRFQSTILGREMELSRKTGKSFSVLLIDVDHFKQVNDRYGHQAGDRVLQHIAQIFTSTMRSGDFAFRHGGEEFMILCVEITPEETWTIAEKIRTAVAGETIRDGHGAEISVTVSIGVALHDGHPDYERLMARADKALYEAKHRGRNMCVFDGEAASAPALRQAI